VGVPFFDLGPQSHALQAEIDTALRRVIDSAAFTGGPEVALFEESFAAYCISAQCVGVSSGTSALHLALCAAGVGPGDEVITTPLTFVATVAAIEYCGATPVLVDCAPESLTLDPNKIGAHITPRTRAIIPVHLHGRLADMEVISRIAAEYGLVVIEDAAQAHGAAMRGRKAGTFGTLGCFSFYPSKNLGAFGEAGAVVTNDAELARKIRLLRNWGLGEDGAHHVKGFNARMHGLQAAVLRVKLARLEAWNAARRAIADLYAEGLRGLDLILPQRPGALSHVYYVYAVRTPERAGLQAWLRQRGIGTHIHYPAPVHLQPAYRSPAHPPGSLPVSERAAAELLSLPMFPEMQPAQVGEVCDAVRAYFNRGAR